VERNFAFACTVTGTSSELTAVFCGRTRIIGLQPGSSIWPCGPVGITSIGAIMINPAYELPG
jgi:hypothetical protein